MNNSQRVLVLFTKHVLIEGRRSPMCLRGRGRVGEKQINSEKSSALIDRLLSYTYKSTFFLVKISEHIVHTTLQHTKPKRFN